MRNYTDPNASFEINLQRRAELIVAAQCEVFDAVAQFVVNRDVDDQQVLREAIEMSLERFGNRLLLPERMIAQLAGRQVNVERMRRAMIKKLPPPVRKDRLGRPIQQKPDVISYRYHPVA